MHDLKEFLTENEYVLWHGTPNKKRYAISQIISGLSPVLAILGFMSIGYLIIRNEPIANPEDIPTVLTVLGIMIFIVFCFSLAGAYTKIKGSEKIIYTVTNKRVIAITQDEQYSIEYHEIYKIKTPKFSSKTATTNTITIQPYRDKSFELLYIDNYYDVYEKINRNILTAKSSSSFDDTANIEKIKRSKTMSIAMFMIPVLILVVHFTDLLVFVPKENDQKEIELIEEIKNETILYGNSLMGKIATVDGKKYKTDAIVPIKEIIEKESITINKKFNNTYSSEVFIDEDNRVNFITILNEDQSVIRNINVKYNYSAYVLDTITHDYLLTYEYLNTENIKPEDVEKIAEDVEHVCGKLKEKEKLKKILNDEALNSDKNVKYEYSEVIKTIYDSGVLVEINNNPEINEYKVRIYFDHNVELIEEAGAAESE